MEAKVIELAYALDTFYFLVMGAFVMWMAAGFTMLESGLVRAKNTAEILTKNISLYSIAVIMYMIVGYNLMYPADGNGIIPALSFFLGADNTAEAVIELLRPIQERFRELESDPAETNRLMQLGSSKAQEIASVTLERAKDNIGLLKP